MLPSDERAVAHVQRRTCGNAGADRAEHPSRITHHQWASPLRDRYSRHSLIVERDYLIVDHVIVRSYITLL